VKQTLQLFIVLTSLCLTSIAHASVSWIPIMNDGITIMIPYTPESVVYKDQEGSLFVKTSEIHGRKYFKFIPADNGGGIVIELTQQEWDELTLTTSNFSIEYGEYTGDSLNDFKFVSSGSSLQYIVRNSSSNGYYVKAPNSAEGAHWYPNRTYIGEPATFSWGVLGGSNCVDEVGNSVSPYGSITYTAQNNTTKSITCGNTSHTGSLTVLASPSISNLPIAIANPVNESTIVVGAIPDNISVGAMGDAQYIMPIATASGSGGFVPDISLSYNSGSKNGYLGIGWSISGISILQTCSKNKVYDNQWESSESGTRLCLDGKRLFAINGDYWAEGAEYQLADKSPLKIIAGYETTNGKVNTYTVIQADGTQHIYGGEQFYRGSTYDIWPLTEKQDVAGNYITYQYNSRTAQLLSVRYTGNKHSDDTPYNAIYFNYEDRDDDYS